MDQLATLAAIGFAAQLIDGALGMAYGTITALALLSIGTPPAVASAMVHTAEIFTCAASGISHAYHRNVDWRLVLRLAPAGVAGAAIGATFLANVDPNIIRPFIAAYLAVLGVIIVVRAWRFIHRPRPMIHAVAPLGFFGGLLDSMGGGWGPLVTSTLVCNGHTPRTAVGSVIVSEAIVAAAATAVFTVLIGTSHAAAVVALVAGGIIAAPLGAYAARHLPHRAFLLLIGSLIIVLATSQLWRYARNIG